MFQLQFTRIEGPADALIELRIPTLGSEAFPSEICKEQTFQHGKLPRENVLVGQVLVALSQGIASLFGLKPESDVCVC